MNVIRQLLFGISVAWGITAGATTFAAECYEANITVNPEVLTWQFFPAYGTGYPVPDSTIATLKLVDQDPHFQGRHIKADKMKTDSAASALIVDVKSILAMAEAAGGVLQVEKCLSYYTDFNGARWEILAVNFSNGVTLKSWPPYSN